MRAIYWSYWFAEGSPVPQTAEVPQTALVPQTAMEPHVDESDGSFVT